MKIKLELESDVAVLFYNLLVKADPLGLFTKHISEYIIKQLNESKEVSNEKTDPVPVSGE